MNSSSAPALTPTLESINKIQILKYMGNKRGLLEWLIPLLKDELKYGETVLDLFAGTSSVGYALKPYVRVFANDVQEYSSVISEALLKFRGRISPEDFELYLKKDYEKNYEQLRSLFEPFLLLENKLFLSRDPKPYEQVTTSFPNYGKFNNEDPFNLGRYSREDFISERRRSSKKFPYILFSVYYSNSFFGLKQSMEIDSLRYAIDQINDSKKRAVYLSVLMYAISKAVNSSGHFAEYLDPNSPNAVKEVFDTREISIVESFRNKLKDFTSLFTGNTWENEVFKGDYKATLAYLKNSKKLEEVSLIYVDPPYSTAQYSRFYHIPETLVKYDYPVLSLNEETGEAYKGRYRSDRYLSKFSQRSNVEDAFSEMFDIISGQTGATLAVSYSDNSIVKPVDRLVEIASKNYKIVEKINGHTHSAQGSRFKKNGLGTHLVHEYLLICKRR